MKCFLYVVHIAPLPDWDECLASMRLLLLFAVLALEALAGSPAHAAEPCASIGTAELDCPPLPRVTYGPNLRVEVLTVKRTLTFPLPKESDGELDDYCPGGKCVCDEAVQYLDFKGPVPGFAQANAAERREAAAMKCSAGNSTVSRDVLRFAVTKAAVSTATFALEYCHGCGGSCHGAAVLAAYDARSGALITLRDAVDPAQFGALKARLVSDFVQKNFEPDGRSYGMQQVGQDIAGLTLDSGLYLEPGRAFVNIDTFALSCAAGPFHPVEIPAAFLKPAFRARL